MKKAAAFLLVIGLLQMFGDGVRIAGERLGLSVVSKLGGAAKGFGLATAASPAPRVFSAMRGLETYSTRFFIDWTDLSGGRHSLEVTPEVNAGVRGPYNRRNVYGAVLAAGPVLVTDSRTRPMFDAVAMYSLCGDAPLLRELGIDPAQVAGRVRVRLEPLSGTDLVDLPHELEPPCP
jgi:hypothetical protein